MPLEPLAQQFRMRMWNTEGGGAGGAGSESSGAGGDPPAGDPKTYSQADIDKLNGALDSERTRAKDFEKTLKSVQAELKKLQDASKPEIERITGERDDLKANYDKALADLRSERSKNIVTAAARDAKARSANAVYALVAPELTYDDDGKPTNVAELIIALQRSDPDLFGEVVEGSGDGGAGSTTTTSSDMNSIIRGMAGRR